MVLCSRRVSIYFSRNFLGATVGFHQQKKMTINRNIMHVMQAVETEQEKKNKRRLTEELKDGSLHFRIVHGQNIATVYDASLMFPNKNPSKIFSKNFSKIFWIFRKLFVRFVLSKIFQKLFVFQKFFAPRRFVWSKNRRIWSYPHDFSAVWRRKPKCLGNITIRKH